MNTVYRYSIPIGNEPVTISVPGGASARPSMVAVTKERPSVVDLWLLVDLTSPEAPRQFFITATGQQVAGRATLIGSALDYERGLVWHLWEAFAPITRQP